VINSVLVGCADIRCTSARQSTEDGNPGRSLFLAWNPELSLRDFHINQLGKFGESSMRDIVPEEHPHKWTKKADRGS